MKTHSGVKMLQSIRLQKSPLLDFKYRGYRGVALSRLECSRLLALHSDCAVISEVIDTHYAGLDYIKAHGLLLVGQMFQEYHDLPHIRFLPPMTVYNSEWRAHYEPTFEQLLRDLDVRRQSSIYMISVL